MAQTLGKYTLVKKLAVGGMGEVWLARQKGPVGFEKLVVIKTLLQHLREDQEFVNMFFDEARIAAVLNHPNIAQIYDLGEEKGEYFIAMEYVHGLSLRDVVVYALEKGNGMPLALKCRVIADAAAALHFAHQAKTPSGQPLDLIHRDVSPQNILIGFNGTVKLIDFGVAKAANKLVRTATGIIKGKYAYMSPEQAYGKPLDGRSDVFGLGTVFWEILCTDRLFKRENETETLQAVVGAEIHPPSMLDRAVPKSLDPIVLKALSRELPGRYESAEAFQKAIEAWLAKQRLPATNAHLAAFMKQLFPDDVEMQPLPSGEVTLSTDKSAVSIEPPQVRAPDEGACQPDARARREGAGGPHRQHPAHPPHARHVLQRAGRRRCCARSGPPPSPGCARPPSSRAPTSTRSPTPPPSSCACCGRRSSCSRRRSRAWTTPSSSSGLYTMDALLKSPFGKSLDSFRGSGPRALFKPLLSTLEPMIAPGNRFVSEAGEVSAKLVFKEEVLPLQLYVGLVRSLFEAFFDKTLFATWEKTAAERVELTLAWR